ncbi:hypothetical protein MD484_g6846, partial [Candolleomyces efflorescens]
MKDDEDIAHARDVVSRDSKRKRTELDGSVTAEATETHPDGLSELPLDIFYEECPAEEPSALRPRYQSFLRMMLRTRLCDRCYSRRKAVFQWKDLPEKVDKALQPLVPEINFKYDVDTAINLHTQQEALQTPAEKEIWIKEQTELWKRMVEVRPVPIFEGLFA